jgi:LysR family hydrogen peroxide-inducible transcriptional activator
MTNLSMKHLRYFDALARHSHFGRAAADCRVTQPALSVQIKELEDLLGAPLVERGARQIRLTSLGETVAARARDVLTSVDEIVNLTRGAHGDFMRELRLGVIPTVAPYLLPALIKALSERYPDLDIRPRETVTQRLIADLGDGKLDAAIVALPVSEPSLTETPLFEEEFVLVRSREEAFKPVPNPKTLREMRLLLLEEGHCFRDQALSFCDIAPPAPRDLMEGSSLSTLVQMVGAGIGITLIPQMAIAIDTRSADVSIARLGDPCPSRMIGMIWRKSNPLASQLLQISDIVRDEGLRILSAAAVVDGARD